MKESVIENAVTKWATERGIMHLKLALWFRRGYPDRIFFVEGGKPYLHEFKATGEEPTKLQWHIINELRKRGYDVGWSDNAEDAIEALKKRCAQATQISTQGRRVAVKARQRRAVR